mgnify:FL=1
MRSSICEPLIPLNDAKLVKRNELYNFFATYFILFFIRNPIS